MHSRCTATPHMHTPNSHAAHAQPLHSHAAHAQPLHSHAAYAHAAQPHAAQPRRTCGGISAPLRQLQAQMCVTKVNVHENKSRSFKVHRLLLVLL